MASRVRHKFDLIVIGSGFAGTAAACFAAARGLSIAQISATGGEFAFASGLLDLLGVYPPHEQKLWDDPWDGIAALTAASPRHPYARLTVKAIRDSLREFLTIVETGGFNYCGIPDRNVVLATAAGTLKATYRVPLSMWRGVLALQEKLPTLLVDFEGMKDFCAGLIAAVLRPRWGALRARRLPFPQPFPGADRQNLQLAEAVESSEVRAALADAIRPHLADAQLVGMPAVLGLRSYKEVIADLEARLGVGIFEIPTLPPSVPGMRLREALEAVLMRQGVQFFNGRRVLAVRDEDCRCPEITVGTPEWRETLEGKGMILATGRFLGGGLTADRNGIRETAFGFPVSQPPAGALWHRERFLDPRGHPINEAGLEIDEQFRPLGRNGRPVFENVFAAGSVLAHQDWIRTKSGAGLAIATAYGAVEAFMRHGGTRRKEDTHKHGRD